MDLIERYLAAIGRQLPSKQVGDITSELRDVLLSRVEDQEAALGRPLERTELEALLIDFGNPLTVAGRYRKVQHLIGPEVFPYWWAGVKIALSIVLGVYLVLVILAAAMGKTNAEFRRTVPDIWYVAVYIFGMVTLVCAAIERTGKMQILLRWKPSRLPPAVGKPRSRFEAAVAVTMDVIFILWWTGLIRFRDVLPQPYPRFITVEMAPVWAAWYWPILGYAVAEIAAKLVAVARPAWSVTNTAILTVRYLFGIAILLGVLAAGRWLVVGSGSIPPHALAIAQTNFDLGMRVGIIATIIGLGLGIALEAWRFYKIRQAMAPPTGA
ncbi:MAG TPA: hypothetical protein VHN39_03045 [Phenylobacterium sp.]|jgi:hypothetical protein|nr:hypothetical protein [Phenylobacterium sp.]